MTKKKYYTPAIAAAQERYKKTHTITVCIRLNKQTDADIIRRLESIPPPEKGGGTGGKQGYIKALIRADMKKQ